jgi:predicted hotdog family 3-hydroxylacyl-ACP dehydratase
MIKYTVDEIIAHDAPMILIDELLSYTDTSAICKVLISPDKLFYDPEIEGIPSYVGTEYMAQTIAAYAGAKAKKRGGVIKVGFLLGSRKYNPTLSQFSNGSELIVTVDEIIVEDSGLSVFDCNITIEGELIVQANINVFQPEDPTTFLLQK